MSKWNEKLRTLLSNREWTQEHFAELMFVDKTTVQKWVVGRNTPSIDRFKEMCNVLGGITLQELLDDLYDVPAFIWVDEYLPYDVSRRLPPDKWDSDHVIYEAGLKHEGMLHRFVNSAGNEYSAIYRAGREEWSAPREDEAQMIRAWNEMYSK